LRIPKSGILKQITVVDLKEVRSDPAALKGIDLSRQFRGTVKIDEIDGPIALWGSEMREL
jgi:hypothetical protein